MKKELLTIGEFSKLANINGKCLRYYDQIGILKPKLIAPSGYRYYSPSQIVLVDAIQLCIDIGIPLKQFHEYYDEESGQLHYNRLFQDGTYRAEMKYQQIKSRLARLELMQNEVNRCEKVQKEQGIMTCSIADTNLWIEPYKVYDTESEQLLHFYPQIDTMKKLGVEAAYDTGRLIISNGGNDSIYIYITVNIIYNDAELPDNVVSLPRADYYCTSVKRGGIFQYESIFPQFVNENKIIIETELYTSEYNSSSPEYELRCLPITKDHNLMQVGFLY